MIKIIALTKERIKKTNIFGADVSIGFADYAEVTHIVSAKMPPVNVIKRVVYLINSTEENGIITTRLILWRVKIEVKTAVEYDFKFA